MHIIATLLFLAALLLAVSVIVTTVIDHKDRIVAALFGRNHGSVVDITAVSNRPGKVCAIGVSAVANEDFRLPLAA